MSFSNAMITVTFIYITLGFFCSSLEVAERKFGVESAVYLRRDGRDSRAFSFRLLEARVQISGRREQLQPDIDY